MGAAESVIERHLVEQVERLDGLCCKMGLNGWPDRICILDGGTVFFVECKARGGRVSPIQLRVHAKLRSRGFRVFVPYTKYDVEAIVCTMRGVAKQNLESGA